MAEEKTNLQKESLPLEISKFLKSRNLEDTALLFIEMVSPFKRFFSSFFTISEPLISIFFGNKFKLDEQTPTRNKKE